MLIVTGVGRCGTSLVAEYLMAIGLKTDNGRYYRAINAGHESKTALGINSGFIRSKLQNKKFDGFKEIKEFVRVENIDFVKDPQFLADTSLIKHWNAQIGVKVILMIREAEDVVKSLRNAPSMNGPNYRNYPDLIRKHQKDFIGVCYSKRIPIDIIDFPECIADPYDLFKALNITDEKQQARWFKVADKNKVHV